MLKKYQVELNLKNLDLLLKNSGLEVQLKNKGIHPKVVTWDGIVQIGDEVLQSANPVIAIPLYNSSNKDIIFGQIFGKVSLVCYNVGTSQERNFSSIVLTDLFFVLEGTEEQPLLKYSTYLQQTGLVKAKAAMTSLMPEEYR